MKKLCVLLLSLYVTAVSAQTPVFKLDWLTDGITAGTGTALTLTGFFLRPAPEPFDGRTLSMSDVNAFDRLAVRPYSRPLDITGDVFQFASLLLPAVLFAAPSSEWLTVGVMYAEAVLFSFGLKNTLKAAVSRPRPFMYYDNPPHSYIKDGDYLNSFPSGHTTMAFTGAMYASYVFSSYFPDSPFKIPVIAGSFTLATATAVLRILSGNHFITDVLAGAFIGCASGFFVPWVHTLNAKTKRSAENGHGTAANAVELAVLPAGCMIKIRI